MFQKIVVLMLDDEFYLIIQVNSRIFITLTWLFWNQKDKNSQNYTFEDCRYKVWYDIWHDKGIIKHYKDGIALILQALILRIILNSIFFFLFKILKRINTQFIFWGSISLEKGSNKRACNNSVRYPLIYLKNRVIVVSNKAILKLPLKITPL